MVRLSIQRWNADNIILFFSFPKLISFNSCFSPHRLYYILIFHNQLFILILHPPSSFWHISPWPLSWKYGDKENTNRMLVVERGQQQQHWIRWPLKGHSCDENKGRHCWQSIVSLHSWKPTLVGHASVQYKRSGGLVMGVAWCNWTLSDLMYFVCTATTTSSLKIFWKTLA